MGRQGASCPPIELSAYGVVRETDKDRQDRDRDRHRHRETETGNGKEGGERPRRRL